MGTGRNQERNSSAYEWSQGTDKVLCSPIALYRGGINLVCALDGKNKRVALLLEVKENALCFALLPALVLWRKERGSRGIMLLVGLGKAQGLHRFKKNEKRDFMIISKEFRNKYKLPVTKDIVYVTKDNQRHEVNEISENLIFPTWAELRIKTSDGIEENIHSDYLRDMQNPDFTR